jgi:hypothetical protein
MAEEKLLHSFMKKQPHAIEPGAFTLDLYRLLCMLWADRQVAKHAVTSKSINELQGMYFRTEVTRILISCATGLRITFDQSPKRSAIEQRDCGKLFPGWATDPKRVEMLGLREACNKIIHATDIRFDVVPPNAAMNPDEEGAYFRPYTCTEGKIAMTGAPCCPSSTSRNGPRQHSSDGIDANEWRSPPAFFRFRKQHSDAYPPPAISASRLAWLSNRPARSASATRSIAGQ